MSLHIVQLANFYTETSGGLRTAVDTLRAGYVDAGHRATLIIPGADDGVTGGEHGTVVTVAAPVIPGSGGYRMITRMSAVRELLEEFQPDRVEISDKATLLDAARWARPRGIPSVLFSHERLDAMLAYRLPRFLPSRGALRRYNKWIANQVDVIVGASSYALREFTSLGVANVELIPLGVDLETFRPPDVRRADDGRLRLVYAGRMSSEKRPDLLVAAADRLARRGVDFQLNMVGDGPLLRDLEKEAAGLPVAFLGHMSDRSALSGVLGQADIALLPSPAETFGLAALEAMACGTPVIVSRGRGAAGLISTDSGLGVRPSGLAIADGIQEIAAIPRVIRESAARRRAELFNWQRTIDSMLGLHEGVREMVA